MALRHAEAAAAKANIVLISTKTPAPIFIVSPAGHRKQHRIVCYLHLRIPYARLALVVVREELTLT